MLIVSDTSPIINLARIGLLHLLPTLFEEIILPPSVYDEIVIEGEGEPGCEEIRTADWVKIVPCHDQLLLSKLKQDLDSGEAEAIGVALELHADYILIDEILGREIAQRFHLKPLGLLGILLRAKSKSYIQLVQPYMDRLRTEANFYIHSSLYNHILTLAGE